MRVHWQILMRKNYQTMKSNADYNFASITYELKILISFNDVCRFEKNTCVLYLYTRWYTRLLPDTLYMSYIHIVFVNNIADDFANSYWHGTFLLVLRSVKQTTPIVTRWTREYVAKVTRRTLNRWRRCSESRSRYIVAAIPKKTRSQRRRSLLALRICIGKLFPVHIFDSCFLLP